MYSSYKVVVPSILNGSTKPHEKKADVINTGQWTKKAIKETKKIGECNVVASSEEATFTYIPKIKQEDLSEDSDYVYICENNTIYGTKYKELPPHEGKLLVADLSSCICSEPIDVSKYDLIFAGAQKNMGPAGVTIVILKKNYWIALIKINYLACYRIKFMLIKVPCSIRHLLGPSTWLV